MTDRIPETDPATLYQEAEVILCCLNLPELSSLNPLMESLEEARKLILQSQPGNQQECLRRLQKAHRLLVEALDLINRNDHASVRWDTLKGMTYMYRGALQHRQGNWMRASDEYLNAGNVFKAIPDRHNAAVAVFARGLLHARQGRLDRVPEVTDALESLHACESGRSVEEAWRRAREAALCQEQTDETTESSPESPTRAEIQNHENPSPECDDRERRSQSAHSPAQSGNSQLRLLVVLAIAAIALGGGLVLVLSGLRGFGVYTAAYPLAVLGYLLVYFFRRAFEIPSGHVALIDSFGQSKLLEGPTSYRCLPFFQRVRALIPVYPLTYMSRKQKIPARGDGSVEISLVVRYQVNFPAHENDSAAAMNNIRRVIDCAQEAALRPLGASAKRQEPWTLEALRPLWHRKLATEISSTLYQVLPAQLASDNLDEGRRKIRASIQDSLEERTERWGMRIERVDIA